MRKVIGLTNVVRSAFSSSDKPLAKTVLCEYHRDKLSAKMVEFAGNQQQGYQAGRKWIHDDSSIY